MDHQPLQGSAGSRKSDEEVRRSGSRSTDPSRRPPSATDNLRRFSTESEDPQRNLGIDINDDDNMNDDSLQLPTNTRSYSWESQRDSDSEDRGGAGGRSSATSTQRRQADQRKFDMTTPTLIDEFDDPEEEEMMALQRARWRQEQQQERGGAGGGGYSYGYQDMGESPMRRTPGASMYQSSFAEEQVHGASMRRTPGPPDMHMMLRSPASGSVMPMPHPHAHQQEQVDESAVLGFGLTLSTPVASSNPNRPQSTTASDTSQSQTNRPPRVPGNPAARPSSREQQQQRQPQQQPQQQPRGEFTFTPWTLANKGEPSSSQFENRYGACSPNTMRLTEDLGNLLFEEEDSYDQGSQQIFRGAAQQKPAKSGAGDQRETTAEEWTSSFSFKSEPAGDVPSRVPRSSMGRGRRKQDSGSRRSRGHDRPSGTRYTTGIGSTSDDHGQQQQHQHQVASFLPYAQQPKPVRSMQTSSQGNPFLTGGFDGPNFGAYQPNTNDNSQQQQQQQPRFFNFGGAFAPPAKDGNVGFRPPAPAPRSEQPSGSGGNVFMGDPQQQHQHFQQTQPRPNFPDVGPSSGGFQSHSFQPLPPMAGQTRDSPFQHPFPSSSPGFIESAASPPSFVFPAGNPYPPPGMQVAGQPQHPTAMQAQAQSHPQQQQPPPMQMQQPTGMTQQPPPGMQPTGNVQQQPQAPPGMQATGYVPFHPGMQTVVHGQLPPGMQVVSHIHAQHPPGMQATGFEFFPMGAPPRAESRPPMQQQHFAPPPQNWPGAPPAQFNPVGAWPGSAQAWPSNEYNYGMPVPQQQQQPQAMDNRPGPSPAPSQTSWQEHGSDIQSQASPSVFAPSPSPHLEPPQQYASISASPVNAPSPARRDQQGSRQSQKGARKGRRGSKQKPEKPKKSEAVATATQTIPRKSTPVNTTAAAEGRAVTPANPRKSTTPVNTSATAAGGSTGGANVKKKKSTKGRDSQTPEVSGTVSVCSTPSNVPTPANVPTGDEGTLSASEDPADSKRSELIESPATRSAFKDFYRRFRTEERSSFQGAEDFAIQSLGDGSLPGKVHWRVYLELADLAKRSNRFADARRLYQQVCQLQPYASQGWLEYSKLEEECGHLSRGARILQAGLEYCEYSENLLTRAIKHEEKMGNIGRARELLARLKHVGIEKVWRTVLEGALLEARAGNVVMARRVLKYLMHHVPWYGPLYLEAYRLERDLGRTNEALQVVERGLTAIPRYGPLWFGAFRLCEEIDVAENQYDLPRTMAMIDRATLSISKELIWKVHLDAAQMLERAALDQRSTTQDASSNDESDYPASILALCRNRFAMTILNCPPNLRWKVWLAAGRLEIAIGNTERARRLFLRAHQVVPEKGRATTLLECARLEEFTGDFDLARAILCRSRVDYGTDWKVWLESVLLEIRGGDHTRAIELAKGALEIHPGTGRLWAALVQLRFFEGGEEAQFSSLRQALNAVPKSGEVWCEGGRIHLNPFSRTFNLERARRHLFFATKFTPQYGDSFLESLRLELLEQWISPIADLIWATAKNAVLDVEELDFHRGLSDFLFRLFAGLAAVCKEDAERTEAETDVRLREIIGSHNLPRILERLDSGYRVESVDLTELELRCANADPNYGLLWFHCRHGPTDTARRILARAMDKVLTELRKFVPLYVVALVRHAAITDMLVSEKESEDDAAWENRVDEILLAAPSLHEILKDVEKNQEEGVVFLENIIAEPTFFATGLAELNRYQPIGELSSQERRKALFGTDALFS